MTKVEKFYEWMLRINNIYLHDNDRMMAAFNKVVNK
jgi:predicted membrane-bound dolichyl-phosphate-mannose-protein mannosyltransferase